MKQSKQAQSTVSNMPNPPHRPGQDLMPAVVANWLNTRTQQLRKE
jgi:hypothetical protein